MMAQLNGGDILVCSTASEGGLGFSHAGEREGLSRLPGIPGESVAASYFNASATHAALGASGQLLAFTLSQSPYLRLIDLHAAGAVAGPSVLPAGAANACAFNPASSVLAVAHASTPYITLYTTHDWAKIENPSDLPTGTGADVSFNPVLPQLAVAHNSSPYVTLYNTSDWTKISNPADLPGGAGLSAGFNHAGTLLAVTFNGAGRLRVYNTADWSSVSIAQFPSGGAFRGRFSPDGSYYAMFARSSPYLVVYSTTGWGYVPDLPLPSGTVECMAWVTNTVLAYAVGDMCYLLDIIAKNIIGQFRLNGTSHGSMFCVPGERRVLSGTVRNTLESGLARNVRAIHAATGRIVAKTTSEEGTGAFEMTVWNADEHNVVCDGGPGELSESIDAVGV